MNSWSPRGTSLPYYCLSSHPYLLVFLTTELNYHYVSVGDWTCFCAKFTSNTSIHSWRNCHTWPEVGFWLCNCGGRGGTCKLFGTSRGLHSFGPDGISLGASFKEICEALWLPFWLCHPHILRESWAAAKHSRENGLAHQCFGACGGRARSGAT